MRRSSLAEKGVFLITGAVDPSSPAEMSGLLPGDLISSFGLIQQNSFISVKESIAPYCQAHVGCEVKITALRKTEDGDHKQVEIIVVPQYWSGYGVLGCHFYNLQDKEGAFAKVKDVLPNSPAERSGLRVKDRIIEFGTVTAETYVDLEKSIGPVLKANMDKPISILLTRVVDGVEEFVQLKMVPAEWSGPGVIGCSLKTIRPASPLTRMAKRLSGRLSGRLTGYGNVTKLTVDGVPMDDGNAPMPIKAPRSPASSSPSGHSAPSRLSFKFGVSSNSDKRASTTDKRKSGALSPATDLYGKGDWGTIKSDDEDDAPPSRF